MEVVGMNSRVNLPASLPLPHTKTSSYIERARAMSAFLVFSL